MFNIRFGLIICIIFTLYGCTKSVKFVNFTNIDSHQWHNNDPKFFMYRNQSSQTSGDIILCFNYTNTDKEQNIEIELEVQTPSRKIWTTKQIISMETTNRVGKIDSKKEIKVLENCEFTDTGVYLFRVRKTSLPTLSGITSIGIAIQ